MLIHSVKSVVLLIEYSISSLSKLSILYPEKKHNTLPKDSIFIATFIAVQNIYKIIISVTEALSNVVFQ